ncbi:MAG: NAD-dependent epimerase/dehydratase family protein [Patescibacteria group bacterium]
MNIFITGALGFIGSHISQHYLLNGDRVMGLDNRSGQYPSRIYNDMLSLLKKHALFSFHSLDVRSRLELASVVRNAQPDIVIHTAALTGVRDGAQRPSECMETNSMGTQNILDACREYKNVRVVLLSSSSVYGDQTAGPFRENALLHPRSIYAISKQAAESIAEYYAHQYKLPMLVIRPFSVYGPRGRMNMLPFLLLRSAITGQPFHQFGNNDSNKRDWTYIDDFVEATSRLIQSKKGQFEVFNIGSGNPIGIDDFVDEFKRQTKSILGKTIIIRKKPKPGYEMEITYADTKKLRENIGPISFTPIQEGIRHFLQFYQKHQSVYF